MAKNCSAGDNVLGQEPEDFGPGSALFCSTEVLSKPCKLFALLVLYYLIGLTMCTFLHGKIGGNKILAMKCR